jgi:MFS family permease
MTDDLAPKKITDGFKRTEESFQIKPAAYRELLKNRNYLRLWIGQIISAMGDWFIVGALFALVYKLSSSSSAISLMMFFRFLPAILLGFLAGVFIDRWDRKATLIFCDLARGALVIAFAFANSLAMVCILTFVVETFSIIYNPAKDASIPLIVDKEQLLNANSLTQVSLFASMALGMGAAGGLIGIFEFLGKHIALFGPSGFLPPQKAVFFIDSLSFLASAWLIHRIQFGAISPEAVTANHEKKTDAAQVKNDFREGFRYMKSHHLTAWSCS